MRGWVVAALVLVHGCRDDHRSPPAPAPVPLDAGVAIVPRLPASPDGAAELRALDADVERARRDPHGTPLVGLLLERASIRGRLEDYVEAAALSAKLVATSPVPPDAWLARARALSRIHRFAD